MMTADDIYAEIQRRLPGWATQALAKTRIAPTPFLGEAFLGDWFLLESPEELWERLAKDPIFGAIAAQFASYHEFLAWLMQQTRIGTAEGPWLDLHASERSLPRRNAESDDRLRARLRRVPDAIIERAIKAAVDAQLPPGIECECFTLRYRQLAWGRHHWGTNKRWAVTVLPAPRGTVRRTLHWGRGHWRVDAWSAYNLQKGPPYRESPWQVALVVVPRLLRTVKSYWRRTHYWSRTHWGGSTPDTDRYAAIRQAVETTRAAGITVWIWIEPEE
jgi:hypothetical protein